MSLPPESLEVGKCYLTDGNVVRRVIMILPDKRIQYEWRGGNRTRGKPGNLSGQSLRVKPSAKFLVTGQRTGTGESDHAAITDRTPENGSRLAQYLRSSGRAETDLNATTLDLQKIAADFSGAQP